MPETTNPAPAVNRGRGRPSGTGGAPSDASRAIRQKKGWSQQRLAQELNCSLSAVRFMERERRLPGTLALLDAFTRVALEAGVPLDFVDPARDVKTEGESS